MLSFGCSIVVHSAFCAGVAHLCSRAVPRMPDPDARWLGLPTWLLDLGREVGLHRPDLAFQLFQSVPPGLTDAKIHGAALKTTASFLEESRQPGSSSPKCLHSLLDGAGSALLNGVRINWFDYQLHLLRAFPGDRQLRSRLEARYILVDSPRAHLFLALPARLHPDDVPVAWLERFSKFMEPLSPDLPRRGGCYRQWKAFRHGVRFRAMLDRERGIGAVQRT